MLWVENVVLFTVTCSKHEYLSYTEGDLIKARCRATVTIKARQAMCSVVSVEGELKLVQA